MNLEIKLNCILVELQTGSIRRYSLSLTKFPSPLYSDLRYHLHGHSFTGLHWSDTLLPVCLGNGLYRHPAMDLCVLAGNPGGPDHSDPLDSYGNLSYFYSPNWVFHFIFILLFPQELINTGLATGLYFIAFIVQLSAWSSRHDFVRGSNITAGVFGLFNFLAYAAGTYFLFIEHKATMN